MFGRLDKSARATLLAFAGHPQLDEVQIAEVEPHTLDPDTNTHPGTLPSRDRSRNCSRNPTVAATRRRAGGGGDS